MRCWWHHVHLADADQVVAAWPTEYPGAAVLRVKIDADRVANAHLRTAACQRITVEVGTDGKVTGLEAAPASARPSARDTAGPMGLQLGTPARWSAS